MRDETELLQQVENFVGALAQCQRLGIKVVSARQNELILELPYSEDIIGNPDSGVIHGGAITTLMDTTSGSAVLCALPELELCPTLDLRVDYMRSAKPGQAVYARASCYRITSNILFMRCEAYQVDRTVGHCVATFMRMGTKGVQSLDTMLQGISVPDFSHLPRPMRSADFRKALAEAKETKHCDQLVEAIPYAQFIGLSAKDEGGERVYTLKQQPSNIGNPFLPAIHGGVIGGFMELSAAMHLLLALPSSKFPKIIDFSLDYLRAGHDRETYAVCEVTRQGGRVANVEIHAWQESRDKPIALARAHFLLQD